MTAPLPDETRARLRRAIEDDIATIAAANCLHLFGLSALNETGAPSAHWFAWYLTHKGRNHLLPTVADLIAEAVAEAVAEATAERDATLDKVRAFADGLTEQGDHHVPGCQGQADCAACVQHDLYAVLDREQG